MPLPDIESSETIPAGKAQTGEPGCNYYPLSLLAKRYRDILFAQSGNPLNPEAGGAYLEQDTGKVTPIAGGVAEMISPANLPQTTPDAPAVVTPPESGFGQDAFAQVIQENEAKGIHGIVFAGIALLPAGIGGVCFRKKRKETGTQDYLRRVLTFCPDR